MWILVIEYYCICSIKQYSRFHIKGESKLAPQRSDMYCTIKNKTKMKNTIMSRMNSFSGNFKKNGSHFIIFRLIITQIIQKLLD